MKLLTEDEICRTGIKALTKAMGLTGAIRFIRSLDRRHGDYTAERAKILGNPSVDEIYRQIKLARARRRRRPSKTPAK
jgi:hypothetical protein